MREQKITGAVKKGGNNQRKKATQCASLFCVVLIDRFFLWSIEVKVHKAWLHRVATFDEDKFLIRCTSIFIQTRFTLPALRPMLLFFPGLMNGPYRRDGFFRGCRVAYRCVGGWAFAEVFWPLLLYVRCRPCCCRLCGWHCWAYDKIWKKTERIVPERAEETEPLSYTSVCHRVKLIWCRTVFSPHDSPSSPNA